MHKIRLLNNAFDYNKNIREVSGRGDTELVFVTSSNRFTIEYQTISCRRAEYQSAIAQMDLIDKIIDLEEKVKLLENEILNSRKRDKY